MNIKERIEFQAKLEPVATEKTARAIVQLCDFDMSGEQAIDLICQGLARGYISTDDFYRLSEVAPSFIDCLEQYSGSQRNLQKMAQSKKITTKYVLECVESQAEQINMQWTSILKVEEEIIMNFKIIRDNLLMDCLTMVGNLRKKIFGR